MAQAVERAQALHDLLAADADDLAETNDQRARAKAMKEEGKGYGEIGKELGLSVPEVMKLLK